MLARRLLLTLGIAAAVAAVPGLALAAAWSVSGTGVVKGSAETLGAPASASAAPTAGSTTTSITVTWTAPSSGPTPTSYRVERVAPAGALGTVTCASGSTTFTCIDNGRTPGTTYAYDVYAVITNWNGTATTGANAATASADTAAPTWTPTCPTSGINYTLGGNGTWASKGTGNCGGKVSGTAADATGISKVEISVQEGTGASTCFTPASSGAFNVSCDSYVDVTSSVSGSTYSLTINQINMTAGRAYRVKVRTTDTLTNSAVVADYTYSVSS